ncbi:MAG: peptide chain release factor N(5)-glutamine methyltransferase [Acidobacteria bacterium]|nr:peptide chain release factor N(5)-glutamine methyltransferase [Acidobacteriota bacterium]
MDLRKTLEQAVAQLTSAAIGSPRMNAEVLLMFALGVDRAYLYAHAQRQLTPEEALRYEELIAERARGVPAQYITGHQEFWGMDFVVTPDVLIPRPETEHLLENALPLARALAHPRIVDVGTGSGCIAVVIAKVLPQAEVHATDISPAALEIARANSARHQLDRRIQFHQTDLLHGLPDQSFDFVLSNPPYVGESEEDQVQLEVRKFEPRHAVFAGPTGLEIIERLIPQAERALRPRGWLMMEISGSIASRVQKLLSSWTEVRLAEDLQGIPRIAIARKA